MERQTKLNTDRKTVKQLDTWMNRQTDTGTSSIQTTGQAEPWKTRDAFRQLERQTLGQADKQ